MRAEALRMAVAVMVGVLLACTLSLGVAIHSIESRGGASATTCVQSAP